MAIVLRNDRDLFSQRWLSFQEILGNEIFVSDTQVEDELLLTCNGQVYTNTFVVISDVQISATFGSLFGKKSNMKSLYPC